MSDSIDPRLVLIPTLETNQKAIVQRLEKLEAILHLRDMNQPMKRDFFGMKFAENFSARYDKASEEHELRRKADEEPEAERYPGELLTLRAFFNSVEELVNRKR